MKFPKLAKAYSVKKAANASPNSALKHERELRCWSQLEVADRIGTTAFNVSRWERGITFPSTYFRQQLCLIFEKSPQELEFLTLGDEKAATKQDSTHDQADATQIFAMSVEESDLHESLSVASHLSVIPTPPIVAETQPAPILLWNVPYRRNQFFIGRKEILQTLHEALLTGNAALTQAQAISGLGGIGKTQTAIEYAYQYRSEYQAVLWVRAETRELLMADFVSIAALLALPEKNDQDQSRTVDAVKGWLSKNTNWLLVLDNADDLDMVSQFMPETDGGHLLLTTRAQSSGQLARGILLEKLSLEEGALFLLNRAKLLTTSEALDYTSYPYWLQARAIAEIMDGLPLALDQAAAYIEETGCGLVGYMERYRQRSMHLLRRRGGLRSQHTEPVATTWSLSFEKVEMANPAASELLRLCAFLHPDTITEEMLTTGAYDLTPHLHLLATDPFALDAAISDLAMFSLLRRDPEQQILTLHRLVQVVLKEQMDENTRRLWAERAVQVVERAFPAVSFTTWSRCQQCLSHALVCVELIAQQHIRVPSALSLLNKAGTYLRERALYVEAERLLTQAQELCEATLAPDDVMIAVSLNNLGMLYHDQGKYTPAEPLLQRALAIYEQAYGPEHLVVAQSLSNLAENYRFQILYSQMEPLVLRALAIREKVLGAEHPELAQSLSQLAMLYQGQGKYAQAEPLYLRTLAIRQQALGSQHIDTIETLNNLAFLYDSQGKYAQAEPLYQQALAFCENNLGTQHMYTAISLHNLAEVYRVQGKYAQAEQLHRQALVIREQTLGSEHPHTGRSLHCLAEIYLAQEKYVLTEPLALQAVDILAKALGKEHPYTTVGLDTLARLYRAQGHYAQAEALATHVLTIYQHTLESDHEYIASSFNTLAEIAFEQGRYSQAEAHLQRALEIQQHTLGAEHIASARSLHTLAMLYVMQGDDNQAEHCFVQALHIRQQVLIPQHPDLIATSQQYAALLRKMGKQAQLLSVENRMKSQHAEDVLR